MARGAATGVAATIKVLSVIEVSPGNLNHSELLTWAVEQITRWSAGQREATIVRGRRFRDFVWGLAAECLTLLLQAELAFQTYRFSNGLMLGTALASVDWYNKITRRKGGVAPMLIAATAAALTLVIQQVFALLASSLPPTITHS